MNDTDMKNISNKSDKLSDKTSCITSCKKSSMRKRWNHRLCQSMVAVLLLLLTVTQTKIPVTATDAAYFIGVNDTLITMVASNLPIWVDGMICLPYTVFDNSTGSQIGLSTSYQRSSNLVTVYNSTGTLIFDIDGESCINGSTQDAYPYRASLRNGIPYLPMTAICNFFNLNFSYHSTPHGNLVHITNSASTLTSSGFMLYYKEKMGTMLEDFMEGPVVVIPPSPTLPQQVSTSLCIALTVTEEQIDMTEMLENWKIQSVFFLNLEQLSQQGNYLRKLYSMGHSIGIQLTATTEEELQLELLACQEILRQQIYQSSNILLLPTGSSSQETLEAEGYQLWSGGQPQALNSPSQTVNGLKQGSAMVYLSLFQSEQTLGNWAELMNLLGEKLFLPQVPLETLL